MAQVSFTREVTLNGRLLKRLKTITVAGGQNSEVMTEEFDFLANVLLVSISPEKKSDYNGLYRSLLVKLASGHSAYVFCYENRDEVARLRPGHIYSFEGHKKPGMRNLSINCVAFYTEPLEVTEEGVAIFPGSSL